MTRHGGGAVPALDSPQRAPSLPVLRGPGPGTVVTAADRRSDQLRALVTPQPPPCTRRRPPPSRRRRADPTPPGRSSPGRAAVPGTRRRPPVHAGPVPPAESCLVLSRAQPSGRRRSLHREEGRNRSTPAKVRPYRAALSSSMLTNADHPASCTDLARRVLPRPFTARPSRHTPWFEPINAADTLW